MKRQPNLTMKLKICDQEISLYVKELEKINLKLHKDNAKFKAQNISYQSEIAALKKFKPKPEFTTVIVHRGADHNDLSPSS